MKIIGVSNFDNELTSDILIAENLQPYWAKAIVSLINKYLCSETSTYYYKAVENTYILYKYEP